MPTLRLVVVFFAVLFGLMYWQAPADRGPDAQQTSDTKDAWDKLRQQIETHRQHFEHTTVFRRHDAKPAMETARAPPPTEAYPIAESEPVQEQIVSDDSSFPESRNEASRPASIPTRASKKTSGERPADLQHAAPRKRFVRITTYERGHAVRVRTFELPALAHRGLRYERYVVPCPNGKCRQWTASILASSERLN